MGAYTGKEERATGASKAGIFPVERIIDQTALEIHYKVSASSSAVFNIYEPR